MPSETIKEQLERILREHPVLPAAPTEEKVLKDRVRKRKERLPAPTPMKDKPCS